MNEPKPVKAPPRASDAPSGDTLTPTQRSERMGRVRNKNTRPEMIVRRLVHGLGYRYRLHGASLPGKPDLVFTARRKVIFVHGCFWHRHGDTDGGGACPLTRWPKSRLEFWVPKLEANRARDEAHQEKLRALGWEFLIVWECELKEKDRAGLERRLSEFLGATTI